MLNSLQLSQLEQMGVTKNAKRMEVKEINRRGKLINEVLFEYENGEKKVAIIDGNLINITDAKGLSTIADYFVRGDYGNSSYRGNCTGLLIKDLLEFYKPKFFMDLCKGSGTGQEVANEMGIPNYCTDLYEGNDLLTTTPPYRGDLVWLHPPYYVPEGSAMPKYSGSQWGNTPNSSDGSHISEWKKFMKWFNEFVARGYENLVPGGRLAILVGDTRYKGELFSPFKEMSIFGKLEHVIIKKQHNTWSEKQKYNGKIIPIEHEYLIIMKKTDSLEIPYMFTKNSILNFNNSLKVSWKNLIAKYIEAMGGSVTREQLFEMLKDHPKAARNNFLKEKIRQVINCYRKVFNQDENGRINLTPLGLQLTA